MLLLLCIFLCQRIVEATDGRSVLYLNEGDNAPPSEGGSHAPYLGTAVEPVSDDLGWRGRQEQGLSLLVSFDSDCTRRSERFDFHMGPKLAVMCPFLTDMRERCLGLPDWAPPFVGRNCQGQQCALGLEEGSKTATPCLLNFFGVSVDTSNSTRSSTCGLDPSDAAIILSQDLNSALPFSKGDGRCSKAVPSGVDSTVTLECVDGVPQLEIELEFQAPMPENYTCVVNPVCSASLGYQSHFVCYVGEAIELGDLRFKSMESKAARDGFWSAGAFLMALWVVLLCFAGV